MKPTRSIGMLIPDSTNQFFSTLAQLLQRELAPASFAIIVVSSDGSAAREQDYLEMLLDMDVAGLAFISVGDSFPAFAMVRDSDRPVVVLDREVPLEGADFVILDNESGIHSAVEYLVGLGHSRIACIGGPLNTEPGRQRTDAFKAAYKMAGLDITPQVIEGDFTFGTGVSAARKLLAEPTPPTAIVACNDLMALGAMQYLHRSGIGVPKEMSIVGFDDIAMASWIYPTLTTVRQDCGAIAKVTAELLLTRITHAESSVSESLAGRVKKVEPKLMQRESCGRPRVGDLTLNSDG